MDVVVALVLAFAFAWLISMIGSESLDRAAAAIAQLVGGWRPDGWPRGVQEEDRDRPWGRPEPGSLRRLVSKDPDPKPRLHRVQATTGHR